MSRKIKLLSAAALLALSMPNIAQAKTEDSAAVEADLGAMMGMEKQLMGMLSKIFGGDEATPIDPKQLKLGEYTAAKLMPDGTLAKLMDGLVDSIFTPIMGMLPEMSGPEIMRKTGIYDGGVEDLDDEKRKAVTAILDPQRGQRGQQAVDAMMPLISDAMSALEAPMRTGLSRAYARKFSAQQLGELNSFFATPTGSLYAAESYVLQADPEVMRAMLQAVPMMLEHAVTTGPAIADAMKKLPVERGLADLNGDEMKKLAGLLDVSVDKLNESRDLMADPGASAEAAVDAADAAAAAVDDEAISDDPDSEENGDES